MKAAITFLATAAGFTAVLLASAYHASHDPQIIVLGALEAAAMIGGLAHLLRHAWQ
jgi:tetrahydromethanopterin S-methyltransferase subunit D